jgi:hypothetical protein
VTEHELRALAPFVDLPDERELAPAVHARLQRPSAAPADGVLGVVAAALCGCRACVRRAARALRDPPVLPSPGRPIESSTSCRRAPPTTLDLGIRLAGRRRAHRGLPAASVDLLGAPDEVTWDGRLLWYRYGARRLLVSQCRASEPSDLVKKVVERGHEVTPVDGRRRSGLLHHRGTHFSTWRRTASSGGAVRLGRQVAALAARAAHAAGWKAISRWRRRSDRARSVLEVG